MEWHYYALSYHNSNTLDPPNFIMMSNLVWILLFPGISLTLVDFQLPGSCLILGLSGVLLAAQSCQTPFNPIDCSPPDSSVLGILQERILEWVAIPFRGSSRPGDRSRVSCTVGIFTIWAVREAQVEGYFISFHFSSLKFLNKFFWCPYTSAKTFFLLSPFHQWSQVDYKYSVKRTSRHPPLRPSFSHCLTNFQ